MPEFFNEAAREAASRALCAKYEYDSTYGLDWMDDMAVALSAAVAALPPRSKALLALAECSEGDLVERVAKSLAAWAGDDDRWYGPIRTGDANAHSAERR